MKFTPLPNEWATTEHALRYLRRADQIPFRVEAESVLLEIVPKDTERILDLVDSLPLKIPDIGRRGHGYGMLCGHHCTLTSRPSLCALALPLL